MVRRPRADDALEVPPEFLQPIPVGTVLYRVHKRKYKPLDGKLTFNATAKGRARFSPLRDGTHIVPTLYAGLTVDCSLMESVFHDVPLRAGVSMDPGRLTGLVLARVRVVAPLWLIDLTSVGLHRFGLQNKDLIDTPPRFYPATQAWAAALYQANPAAQGLYWTSRLDNRTQAMMFFGERPGVEDALEPEGRIRSLHRISGGPILEVLRLAERIGVDFAT